MLKIRVLFDFRHNLLYNTTINYWKKDGYCYVYP